MWRDDDAGSVDIMDEEGNYFQADSSHSLPDIIRGLAPQRLNMAHGFIRHIVSVVYAVNALAQALR